MTIEDKIQEILDGFPWGKVIGYNRVENIVIVTYNNNLDDIIMFHPYIIGAKVVDTQHGFDSMDEAIVHAIARKYDELGANTKADTYFFKMIGKY